MSAEILRYNSGVIEAQLYHTRRALVHDVTFTVHAGESLALIGETGSGKTMIALSILGVLPRNVRMRDGHAVLYGTDLSDPRKCRAALGRDMVYIPQNGAEFLNPTRTVAMHLKDGLRRAGVPAARHHQAALEKLAAVGFSQPESILPQYPFQLSGGMAQRVTIALAACAEAKLVIADEPTNGLDGAAKAAFYSQLDTLFPAAGKLIITHDMDVASLCPQTLVLCGGSMMEKGPSSNLLSAPKHPYTQALKNALVANGMRETPVLREQSGQCPFYCRCTHAQDGCCAEISHHTDDVREWWCALP